MYGYKYHKHTTTTEKITLTCDEVFFLIFFGEQGKRKKKAWYIYFTNHPPPLPCLPVKSDVILCHAINVSQLDFTRLKICGIHSGISISVVGTKLYVWNFTGS